MAGERGGSVIDTETGLPITPKSPTVTDNVVQPDPETKGPEVNTQTPTEPTANEKDLGKVVGDTGPTGPAGPNKITSYTDLDFDELTTIDNETLGYIVLQTNPNTLSPGLYAITPANFTNNLPDLASDQVRNVIVTDANGIPSKINTVSLRVGIADYATKATAGTFTIQKDGYTSKGEIIADNSILRLRAYSSNGEANSTLNIVATSVNSYAVRSSSTNNVKLGDSDYKWRTVYAAKGTIDTSDRNEKTDIVPIEQDERYLKIFDYLKPVKYRFKNIEGELEHDRIHTGFIAQDIEEAMKAIGLNDLELAAFCRDAKHDKDGNEIPGEYTYGLRYSEIIALNTAAIKRLENRVSELEERIKILEMEGTQG